MIVFRILGSFWIAVAIMSLFVILLPLATFFEASYGDGITRWLFYHTNWFYLLCVLLCLNILFSMVARLPWNRRKIPFLLAHIGILVLFFGCFLTHRYGEEAMLNLFEGQTGRYATVYREQEFRLEAANFAESNSVPEKIAEIPFKPGPLDWRFYNDPRAIRAPGMPYRGLFSTAIQFASPERGVVYDEGEIKIEVLDFLFDPQVEIENNPFELTLEGPNLENGPEQFSMQMKADGFDSRAGMIMASDGTRLTIEMAKTPTEVKAFTDLGPEKLAEAGKNGQISLLHAGKTYRFSVEQMLKEQAESGGKSVTYPLGDSGLGIELQTFDAPNIILNITGGSDAFKSPNDPYFGKIELSSISRETKHYSHEHGIYGAYWGGGGFERFPEEMLKFATAARLEFLQGPDGRLYYRYVTYQDVYESGELELSLSREANLNLVPGTENALKVKLKNYLPCQFPGIYLRSHAIPAKGGNMAAFQFARIRASYEGKAEEYWVRLSQQLDPLLKSAYRYQDDVVWLQGDKRTISFVWKYRELDLGFGVRLREFTQKIDPGTSVPAHYSSLVDKLEIDKDAVPDPKTPPRGSEGFIEPQADAADQNVLIRMNRPAMFRDPASGRVYRFYQNSCSGPFPPGSTEFRVFYGDKPLFGEERPRDGLFSSALSVNYDPGRGLKYLGCFMLLLGSAMLCYRKGRVKGEV